MSLNPARKIFCIAHIEQKHVAAALNALSTTPQPLATVAAALGISQDDCEKYLGLLVDEALAVRTIGSRITARYFAT
jgi:hypothetical protein